MSTPNDSGARSTPVTSQPEGSRPPATGEEEDEGGDDDEVTVEMPPAMEEIHTVAIPGASAITDGQEENKQVCAHNLFC